MTHQRSRKHLKDLETPPWRSENPSTLNKTRTAKTKTTRTNKPKVRTPTLMDKPTNKRRNERFRIMIILFA
jgi:hypothetical protein